MRAPTGNFNITIEIVLRGFSFAFFVAFTALIKKVEKINMILELARGSKI